MRSSHGWSILFLALAFVAAGGCSHDGLDDGDSADVVMEIRTMETQPITAAQSQGGGGCTFTIVEWTATVANVPKSELAGPDSSPFNDIIVDSVTITYEWLNPAFGTVTRVKGLAGTIPADETGSISFSPIEPEDIPSDGVSANLTMLFQGHTVENESVSATAGATLIVNSCPVAP
jgi:hypothetical protein